MKKILSMFMGMLLIGSLLATNVKAVSGSPIENMSIDESIEYFKTLGYEVEIIDYDKITKGDLEELLKQAQVIPEVINLTDDMISSQYEEVSDVPVTYESGEYIESNVRSYKDYTGLTDDNGNGWTWSVRIQLIYNRYVSPDGKYFTDIQSSYSENPLNVTKWSYAQSGGLGTSFNSNKSSVNIVGSGKFSLGVGSLAIHHPVSFNLNMSA